MAYREFPYEKYFEAPDTSGFLDNAAQSASHAIASVFQSIHNRNEQKKQMANEYNYTLAKGISENDNIYFEQGAKTVTNLMKEGIKSGDRSKMNKAQELASSLEVQHQNMRKQNEILKNADEIINQREKDDVFYNGNPDRQRLNTAFHGEDFDGNHVTRGPALEQAAKTIGGSNPDTFKMYGDSGYMANYIKSFGVKEKEKKGLSGKVDTIYDKSPFWQSNGKPGVSDQHVYDFLNSDPEGRAASYMENEVTKKMREEAKSIRAQGGDAMKPFKDMSDEDMINFMKTPGNEKYNTVNKTSFGKRVSDFTKVKLTEGSGIISRIDYGNANEQKKPWKNDHFATWNKPITVATASSGTKATGEHGEISTNESTYFGGSLLQDSGKPIMLTIRNPSRINTQTGKVEKGNVGAASVSVDSYIQVISKKNGSLITPKGETIEEREEFYKTLPYEYGRDAEPTLQIAVNGSTINKASIIGDQIGPKQKSISTQIAQAKQVGDDDKVKKLQTQLEELNELAVKFNAADPNDPNYDPDELSIAASAQGITIKNEYIYKADAAMLSDIKGISGGFSPSDPQYQSEDMKREQVAYSDWYAKASASGFKTPGKEITEQKPVSDKKIKVIGPDGKAYMLPERQKDEAISQGYKIAP